MAEPASDPLTGVLIFAVAAVAPTALCWLALQIPPLVRHLRERCRPPVPAAYEDLLIHACYALAVEHQLATFAACLEIR